MRSTLSVSLALTKFLLLTIAVANCVSAGGQTTSGSRRPAISAAEDWSYRHLVFSHGSSRASAEQKGAPSTQAIRYYQQWAHRSLRLEPKSMAAPASIFSVPQTRRQVMSRLRKGRRPRPSPIPRPEGGKTPSPKPEGDWSYYLGGSTGAGVSPNVYPAKWTFDVTREVDESSCGTDFVAFPTNQSGRSLVVNPSEVTGTFLTAFSGDPGTVGVTLSKTGSMPVSINACQDFFGISCAGANSFAISNNFWIFGVTWYGPSTLASNLAAAINANTSTTGVSAIAVGSSVTLTTTAGPDQPATILASTLPSARFVWSGEAIGGSRSGQPSVVAFNNLYSGEANDAVVAAARMVVNTNTVSGGASLTLIPPAGSPLVYTASDPVAATGTLTFSARPAADSRTTPSRVTIGTATYVFVDLQRPATAYQVYRGTTIQRAAQNLAAAINGDSSMCSTSSCFGAGTAANDSVQLSELLANGLRLSARVPGSTTIPWSLATAAYTNISLFPAGAINNGSDGITSANSFAYWSGSAPATPIVLAANLATAIHQGGGSWVDASSSGNQITITAKTAGAQANQVGLLTNLGAGVVAPGTLSGGVDAAPAGLCGSAPTVLWAYKSASTPILTSPLLSWEGDKLAFVEQGSPDTGAILHVLRWKAGEGSVRAPADPVIARDGASYQTCLARTATSCELQLNYSSRTNSNSSPFYDFDKDALYVGDDGGVLHKITGVFHGTPSEAWQVTVNSGQMLTGPVYDGNSSRNIFVGDSSGVVSYVREVGSSRGSCVSGNPPCLGLGQVRNLTGISDPPIVDSATERVFVFSGQGPSSAVVVQADTALSGGSQVTANIGQRSTYQVHLGTFDDEYYSSDDPSSGSLYVCGKGGSDDYPTLYRLGFDSAGLMNPNPRNSLRLAAAAGECSPLTEVRNPAGDHDWLFVGIPAGCAFGGDTNGCLMSFDLPKGGDMVGFPTVPYATAASPGGTSAIVVDNRSAAGQASSLYYSTLGDGECGQLAGDTSGCAVKRTQQGLR